MLIDCTCIKNFGFQIIFFETYFFNEPELVLLDT